MKLLHHLPFRLEGLSGRLGPPTVPRLGDVVSVGQPVRLIASGWPRASDDHDDCSVVGEAGRVERPMLGRNPLFRRAPRSVLVRPDNGASITRILYPDQCAKVLKRLSQTLAPAQREKRLWNGLPVRRSAPAQSRHGAALNGISISTPRRTGGCQASLGIAANRAGSAPGRRGSQSAHNCSLRATSIAFTKSNRKAPKRRHSTMTHASYDLPNPQM